jgi:predicted hotdog family 3-hydroxylacyl-ACP dehydratase
VLLNHDWIARHIPHAERMCLLDEVLEWDARHIRCRSSSHRAPDNPLRAHGRLGAACGIEYAAQSMAVHGALLAGTGPAGGHGYLASVRSVSLFVERLDDLESDLIAIATRITSDNALALYEFSVSDAQRILLNGRATVILDLNGG